MKVKGKEQEEVSDKWKEVSESELEGLEVKTQKAVGIPDS